MNEEALKLQQLNSIILSISNTFLINYFEKIKKMDNSKNIKKQNHSNDTDFYELLEKEKSKVKAFIEKTSSAILQETQIYDFLSLNANKYVLYLQTLPQEQKEDTAKFLKIDFEKFSIALENISSIIKDNIFSQVKLKSLNLQDNTHKIENYDFFYNCEKQRVFLNNLTYDNLLNKKLEFTKIEPSVEKMCLSQMLEKDNNLTLPIKPKK